MKLVLIGPPGAGKSTQGQHLSRKLSYFHVSTGNLVRAHIQSGTDLGCEISDYNRRGELIPDGIVMDIVAPNLEPSGRWILDGFPRNETQARALDAALDQRGLKLTKAVFLEVPPAALIERVSQRRFSQATGWTYNLQYDPPPQPEQHLDPGPFVRREDDDREVFRRQLDYYHKETEELKDYYDKKGILASVDGNKRIPAVTEAILRSLNLLERQTG